LVFRVMMFAGIEIGDWKGDYKVKGDSRLARPSDLEIFVTRSAKEEEQDG
jgi:hypothetical protein